MSKSHKEINSCKINAAPSVIAGRDNCSVMCHCRLKPSIVGTRSTYCMVKGGGQGKQHHNSAESDEHGAMECWRLWTCGRSSAMKDGIEGPQKVKS